MEKKLRDWLSTQGYPLEMRVAREFRDQDFRVFQSDYYRDPDTDVPREIDVTAMIQRPIEGVLVRAVILVECKTSRDKPWILFTAPTQLANRARIVQRAASKLGRRLLRAMSNRKEVQQLPIFKVEQRSAYGMTQAFTSSSDKAYQSAISVSKATAASVAEADSYEKVLGNEICELAFPVIVVGGELVEASLGENEGVDVRKVQSGTLLWRNPAIGTPHTIIHVITEAGMPTFVEQARNSIIALLDVAKEELPELIKSD